MVFGPDNLLRHWLADLVTHRHFDHIILVLILLSSLCLALESPGLDPTGTFKQALDFIDIVFVGLFAAEAVLKILVCGLVFNGPGSYLRNYWNVLDFVIVVIGEAFSRGGWVCGWVAGWVPFWCCACLLRGWLHGQWI